MNPLSFRAFQHGYSRTYICDTFIITSLKESFIKCSSCVVSVDDKNNGSG